MENKKSYVQLVGSFPTSITKSKIKTMMFLVTRDWGKTHYSV